MDSSLSCIRALLELSRGLCCVIPPAVTVKHVAPERSDVLCVLCLQLKGVLLLTVSCATAINGSVFTNALEHKELFTKCFACWILWAIGFKPCTTTRLQAVIRLQPSWTRHDCSMWGKSWSLRMTHLDQASCHQCWVQFVFHVLHIMSVLQMRSQSATPPCLHLQEGSHWSSPGERAGPDRHVCQHPSLSPQHAPHPSVEGRHRHV